MSIDEKLVKLTDYETQIVSDIQSLKVRDGESKHGIPFHEYGKLFAEVMHAIPRFFNAMTPNYNPRWIQDSRNNPAFIASRFYMTSVETGDIEGPKLAQRLMEELVPFIKTIPLTAIVLPQYEVWNAGFDPSPVADPTKHFKIYTLAERFAKNKSQQGFPTFPKGQIARILFNPNVKGGAPEKAVVGIGPGDFIILQAVSSVEYISVTNLTAAIFLVSKVATPSTKITTKTGEESSIMELHGTLFRNYEIAQYFKRKVLAVGEVFLQECREDESDPIEDAAEEGVEAEAKTAKGQGFASDYSGVGSAVPETLRLTRAVREGRSMVEDFSDLLKEFGILGKSGGAVSVDEIDTAVDADDQTHYG
jgi:hypothetical protein